MTTSIISRCFTLPTIGTGEVTILLWQVGNTIYCKVVTSRWQSFYELCQEKELRIGRALLNGEQPSWQNDISFFHYRAIFRMSFSV